MKRVQWLSLVVALLGFAIMVRTLFPKRVEVIRPPRIITVWDTVRTIDTTWLTRVRHDTVKINVLERVVVTVPETILVVPQTVGITAASIGAKPGDSSLVAGFSLTPVDSGYERRAWTAQFFTLGPVKSISLNGDRPQMNFYDPPPKGCGFWCTLGHYATGAAVGTAAGFAVCKAS